jgi:hypothetical protein
MLILVFIINLATLNCHDSKDAILALEHGIQTAQPWGIGGRKIYFHIASPKEIHVHLTVLLYNYTFLKIFFEITVYVVAKTQRSDHQMKINVIERISNGLSISNQMKYYYILPSWELIYSLVIVSFLILAK